MSIVSATELKVWKTIKLGTINNVEDYKNVLKQAHCILDTDAGDMLNEYRIRLQKKESTVDLVLLSIADLGLGAEAEYQAVCDRAFAMGLKLCPRELGPALRVAYQDQPIGERLIIAMRAVWVTTGGMLVGLRSDPHVFEIGRDKMGKWLSADDVGYYGLWKSKQFVFRKPKG